MSSFLPLLGAFIAHGPVLRFDFLRALARPVDGGATIRGRRVSGVNKTWRGVIVMMTGIVAFTCVLAQLPAYWLRLPPGIQRAGPLIFGLLLAAGAATGELANSFCKRGLGIPPGARQISMVGALFIVLDQGDFVLGAWLFLAPVWLMPLGKALLAFGGSCGRASVHEHHRPRARRTKSMALTSELGRSANRYQRAGGGSNASVGRSLKTGKRAAICWN